MEYFKKAVPVWESGKEKSMNYPLCFIAHLPAGGYTLYLASSALCRVVINDTFVSASTARTAHGHLRVDIIDIEKYLTCDDNVLKIYAIGYYVNSFEYAYQPSTLCAEVREGERVAAATGVCGFDAYRYEQKLIKTTRYSFQRAFSEVYDLTRPECGERVELIQTDSPRFISRGSPYPEYPIYKAKTLVGLGRVGESEKEKYFSDRCVKNISEIYKGFTLDEAECFPAKNYQIFDFEPLDPEASERSTVALPDNSYVIFDMGREVTGFIEAQVICDGDTTLYFAFDEIMTDGDVDPFRLTASSIVQWKMKKGTYRISTLEPYCLKYLKAVAHGQGLILHNVCVRACEFPESKIKYRPDIKDDELKKIFDAAKATFMQNTVDIFMDCPSRERAGWLCDSFFTARTEYALTGKTQVEHDFLENFVLCEKFDFIPDGMLPMCYPGDHTDGVYIPNWAMWFVVELEEYLKRSGDIALVEAARDKVYRLLDFFRTFENGDGLLQKLPNWVFIEWSRSNDFVQDISYPTNMLYSLMKKTIGRLYNDENTLEQGERLAEVIRKTSYKNGFFADNALLDENGKACVTDNFTESNQYYAFFTEVATPQLYPQLWEILTHDFGPQRKKTGKRPEIHHANAFIGNYLRLELLYRYGLYDKLREEIKGYFLYMAEKTGTLWENDTDLASCNHGFASHVIYWLKGMDNKQT